MWKMKRFVFALISLAITTAQADQTWVYLDIASVKKSDKVVMRDAIEIQSRTPPSVTIGDLGHEATFCPKDSSFVCVKSQIFEFGVPKEITKMRRWTINNSEYQIMGEDSVRLLGKELKIFYIDRKTKEGGVRYLYSPSDGLIAFTPWSKDKSRFYILEGQTGFGIERSH